MLRSSDVSKTVPDVRKKMHRFNHEFALIFRFSNPEEAPIDNTPRALIASHSWSHDGKIGFSLWLSTWEDEGKLNCSRSAAALPSKQTQEPDAICVRDFTHSCRRTNDSLEGNLLLWLTLVTRVTNPEALFLINHFIWHNKKKNNNKNKLILT